MLGLSDTFISMPVIVHEFVDHAVDAESLEKPAPIIGRACLFRVLIPPDKLNPKVLLFLFRDQLLAENARTVLSFFSKQEFGLEMADSQESRFSTPEGRLVVFGIA